jgi:hypothetical protein
MSDTFCCWRCGAPIAADDLPIRRAELCRACNADLHACKLCTFYNPSVANACEEPIALAVTNKERSNYCDYFKPTTRAWKGGVEQAQQRAKAELDALFGAVPPTSGADPNSALSELERLFKASKE